MRALGVLCAILTAGPAWAGTTLVLERGDQVEEVHLRGEALVTVERLDVQLGERRTFRGVPLVRLVRARAAPPGTDTVVLGFDNGMRVPVRLADLEALDALVALESRSGKEPFSTMFPEVKKKKTATPDPRPLRFLGNKLVLTSTTHPRVPPTTQASPWLYVDALTSIRWVDGLRYEHDFGGLDQAVAAGREVFLTRCQWCHGVAGHGARYGWDFVRPVPLYEWRSARSLHAHVRFRNADAVERGYMMQPQLDATEAEISLLHAWMRALVTMPVPSAPPGTAPAPPSP